MRGAAAPATATADAHDPLRPQRGAGMRRGAGLALLVHGALLLALALGVSWRASEPTGASAELWAAVPEFAAAAPVPPPPQLVQVSPPVPKPQPAPKVEPKPEPSRDAEIAIEKARLQKEKDRELDKEKERQSRAEAEKKKLQAQDEQRKKLAAAAARADQADKLEKATEKAEEERLEKLRQDNLKRMQGQAGATGGPTATGSAARDAGPSASYAGRIIARVKPNIVLTETLQGSPRAEVEVRAAADGTILGRRLVKPSGEKAWDDAVLRAIDRTDGLPRDVDGRVPSTLTLIFTP